MLCEEANDELMRLPRFREVGSEQEESVVHAIEQQQLRVHSVFVEIEMALYRSAHIEGTRPREEERGREFPLFILGRSQWIYRLRVTIRRR